MTFDLLIKHGTVIDGTGAPGIAADIGVSGGRITALGPGLAGGATHEIDASGRIVAPGFIDVHTHSDFTLLNFPGADSKVRQGQRFFPGLPGSHGSGMGNGQCQTDTPGYSDRAYS